MSRKTEAAYKAVFKFINAKVMPLDNASSFTTDYERAMRNALRKLYPTAALFACYFHYCQALKRRASQTAGFVKFIQSNEKAR